ncbi:MAG: toprim domain-containing protein [Spirochaetaceae bacterium]|jgi:replicative DNA helicase|nr:toprim domain-containing protein [Spirochaetaceae bacterium]
MPVKNKFTLIRNGAVNTSDPDEFKSYIEIYLRQKGINLRGAFHCLNPGHRDENPSMSYNAAKHYVHCFACGVTYDLFDIVGLDYGLEDFPAKVGKVREIFGTPVWPISNEYKLEREKERKREKEEFQDRSAEFVALINSSEGCSYFRSRGISQSLCKKYSFFQNGAYAYMPVFSDGICAGWSARAIDGDVPRYKNSVGALPVWNLDRLFDAENSMVGFAFISEGIINAASLEECYLNLAGKRPEAVFLALCGSGNLGKLVRFCAANLEAARRWIFVVCGDPDSSGSKMNMALCAKLGKLGLKTLILDMPEGRDANALLLENTATLSEALTDFINNTQPAPKPQLPNTPESKAPSTTVSALEALDSFFAYVDETRRKRVVSSGFPAIDSALGGGLYPGLYTLGAVSSLGKTSLVLQMADKAAETGTDVLFFSLEQSRNEIIARSLSRISRELSFMNGGFSSRELLSGKVSDLQSQELLGRVRSSYEKTARRLFIYENKGNVFLEDIAQALNAHILNRGSVPFVVIDYLQILRSSRKCFTDKQNTDDVINGLKAISRNHNLPLLAVSSFNRTSYKSEVSMEAFKESGSLEYSSDILMGLQMSGVGSSGFDINSAKQKEPRQVELVLLKNRDGAPYAKIKFNYYAKYNLFAQK